jgi:hypothetical protein
MLTDKAGMLSQRRLLPVNKITLAQMLKSSSLKSYQKLE